MALINNISQLNERIDIYKLTPSKGPEPTEEEKLIHSCWCHVKTSMINDVRNNQGTILEGTTTFVIRSQQPIDIDNKMKIGWNNKRYDIVKINEDTSKKDYDVIIAKVYE